MGWKARLWLSVGACLAPLLLTGTPATAGGYQIAITQSTPTTTYGGGTTPTFRATLTVPGNDLVTDNNFYLLVDGHTSVGSISGSAPTYTLYDNSVSANGPNALAAGQHTVAAQFASAASGLVTSAPVTLTVMKGTPGLMCGLTPTTQTYLPSTPLTMSTEFTSLNAAVDWQNGMFAITFAGSQTFTTGGLVANGSGQVAVTTPPVPGTYRATCGFGGTANINPVQAGLATPSVTVSSNHAIGGIQLRTDPAPVQDNVTMTWNVAVLGASGLPAPTGNVSIRIGASFTPIVALGAGGSVTFQTNPAVITNAGPIKVWYYGDPWYAASGSDFPLSTSPIGGAAGSSSSAPPAAATGTAQGGAAPAATVSDPTVAANTPGQAPVSQPTQASAAKAVASRLVATPAAIAAGGGRSWIVVVALTALIAAGIAGLGWWLRLRSPRPA